MAAMNHNAGCRCVVHPSCLHQVRTHWMISLEAITHASEYSRDYLTDIEQGAGEQCVDLGIIRAYEAASGRPIEVGLFETGDELMTLLWYTHASLRRLSEGADL